MTLYLPPTVPAATGAVAEPARLRPVTFDLYRDIHKAIRSELFAVTMTAGSLDATDEIGAASLAAHVGRVARLLAEHAEHEDAHIQPLVVALQPALAEQIEHDHTRFDSRILQVAAVAAELGAIPAGAERRAAAHELYVELALFVSGYLAHQDLEERLAMPVLDDALGTDAVVGIHLAIVGSIPPDVMMRTLAVMLPALNVDDRTELLAGMRETAPAEAFEAVWGLTRSVLARPDVARLAARLGLPA